MPHNANQLTEAVVTTQNLGIMVLNHEHHIILHNTWIIKHAGLDENYIKQLDQFTFDHILPEKNNPRLITAIDSAIQKGMSSVLSQVFNPSPFPFYSSDKERKLQQRIAQQITVTPIKTGGERYAMIEIRDVSAAVEKEKILRQRTKDMQTLANENTAQKQHLEAVLNSSSDAIITLNREGKITHCNNAAHRIFDCRPGSLTQMDLVQFIPGIESSKGNWHTINGEYRGYTQSHQEIHLDIMTNKLDQSSEIYVSIIRDISSQKKIRDALYKEEQLANITLQTISEAVLTTNEKGIIELVNPVGCQLLQLDADDIINKAVTDIFTLKNESSLDPIDNIVIQALRECTIIEAPETAILCVDGTQLPVMATATPLLDDHNNTSGCVIVFRDVRESRTASSRLNWQANHDALTRLPNRRSFESTIKNTFANIDTHNHPQQLLFLDLDEFKYVNDTAGHAAGDELLKTVSKIFLENLNEDDFLARIGGDEFAIILNNLSFDLAIALAKRLCEKINKLVLPWNGDEFSIGVSIGLVPVTHYFKSENLLLDAADNACYKAKNAGKNQVYSEQPPLLSA